MHKSIRIAGAIVNHNTSHFTELLLRTLMLTHQQPSFQLDITVLDNGSDDEHLPALRSYLATQQIPCIQTGFDTAVDFAKHGAALAAFVAQRSDCSYYLCMDADTWFIEPHTIDMMMCELAAAGSDTFANQARIYGYYADRIIEGRDGVPGMSDATDQQEQSVIYDGRPYRKRIAARCSPVCTLIANTPQVRNVVTTVGMSPLIRFEVGAYTYYDTFGMLTQVMHTHRQRFIVSATTINHFTESAHRPDLRAPKDRDCLLMLDHLRAGGGLTLDSFFVSEWVRQQRKA